jgi:hypothetical protein
VASEAEAIQILQREYARRKLTVASREIKEKYRKVQELIATADKTNHPDDHEKAFNAAKELLPILHFKVDDINMEQ